jgi:hypothetical protein
MIGAQLQIHLKERSVTAHVGGFLGDERKVDQVPRTTSQGIPVESDF